MLARTPRFLPVESAGNLICAFCSRGGSFCLSPCRQWVPGGAAEFEGWFRDRRVNHMRHTQIPEADWSIFVAEDANVQVGLSYQGAALASSSGYWFSGAAVCATRFGTVAACPALGAVQRFCSVYVMKLVAEPVF